jgi:2-haloacid dehalogenase
MNPSIVVFDVGNVLIRWDPRFLYRKLLPDAAAVEDFLARICPPEWNLEQDRGRSWDAAIAERVAIFPEHAALIRAFSERWHEMVPGEVLGSVAILEELRGRGVPLYAITNFSAEKWAEALPRFPFLGRFRDTVVSAHERLLKPDAAIYQVLLERNKLAAADCLFIDDSLANARGAEAVGMRAHHFTDAATLRADLRRLGLL